ncbi:MAG: hypothetical protein NUW01_05960 [Gemmatimonadaceae bacterium]|nr:hypothetical protein [Gemmatimonadaceae bacterium]
MPAGVITYQHNAAVTVGTASTEGAAANSGRSFAIFINDSDEALYIAVNEAAVLNQGIRLNANGGSYTMSEQLGNLSTAAVNAICTSGGKLLLVTESTAG